MDIWVIELEGSSLRQLTSDPARDSYPVWSPDGVYIAFHSDRSGNTDIWLMQADGSGLRQLTDSQTSDMMARWLP